MNLRAGPDSGPVTAVGPLLLRLTRVAAVALSVAACQHDAGRLSALGPPPPPRPSFGSDLSQVVVGQRLLAQNENEAALKAFNAAMIEEGVSHDAMVGAAAANYRLGRVNLAKRILVRAAEQYPNSAEVRNNLGVVYHRLGDYPHARAEYNAAFALKSGLSEEISRNLALLEIAEERAGNEDVELDAADYYVVPQGGGVFRLEQAEGAS